MNQVWPHLEHLDDRFDAVVQYLNEHLQGDDQVVDLNCGDSRILQSLRPCHYTGTDAIETRDGRMFRARPTAKFIKSKDDKLTFQRIDTLMCWGIGGYEISKEEVESPTITQTIIKLIEKHRPHYVVVEAIQEYQSILRWILDSIDEDYTIRIDEKMNLGEPREWKRQIYLLERTNETK